MTGESSACVSCDSFRIKVSWCFISELPLVQGQKLHGLEETPVLVAMITDGSTSCGEQPVCGGRVSSCRRPRAPRCLDDFRLLCR